MTSKAFYREGLALSALVHLGLVFIVLLGLPRLSRDIPDMPEIIPVDFVEIAEETRSDEPVPTIAAEPEPEPQLAPAEAEPERLAEAVPLPDSKPAPPESKPAPPEPRLRVTPRTKPNPPSRFDPTRVAALIDRSLKERAPAPVTREPEAEDSKAEPRRQSALSDRLASATLQAAIRQRVQSCWFVPAGAKDLETMQVRIRIQLRRDGQLMRPPQFLDAGDLTKPGNEYFRIFAESARRAILNCQPYDNLPLAQYELWQQIDFTFDARQMLGG